MMSSAAVARLGAELDLKEGRVASAIDNPSMTTPTFQISRDAFLLTLSTGLVFHYRRGFGTVYQRPPNVTDDEVSLFFDGSVYGAIAWLNGLVPLHASAVVHAGEVYAFTGLSGEGKSTLATALGQRGMTVFSDDVLMLDLADPARIMAIAGHQRSKLWADAMELTGKSSAHAVAPGIDKYYVSQNNFWDGAALPIRQLYLLQSDDGEPPDVTAIRGAQRFNALRSAYYRPHFGEAISIVVSYFEITARIGEEVGIGLFNRSREKANFNAGIDLIAAHIHAMAAL